MIVTVVFLVIPTSAMVIFFLGCLSTGATIQQISSIFCLAFTSCAGFTCIQRTNTSLAMRLVSCMLVGTIAAFLLASLFVLCMAGPATINERPKRQKSDATGQ